MWAFHVIYCNRFVAIEPAPGLYMFINIYTYYLCTMIYWFLCHSFFQKIDHCHEVSKFSQRVLELNVHFLIIVLLVRNTMFVLAHWSWVGKSWIEHVFSSENLGYPGLSKLDCSCPNQELKFRLTFEMLASLGVFGLQRV